MDTKKKKIAVIAGAVIVVLAVLAVILFFVFGKKDKDVKDDPKKSSQSEEGSTDAAETKEIERYTDEEGNQIEKSTDESGNTIEIITDPEGNVTQKITDSEGNVTESTLPAVEPTKEEIPNVPRPGALDISKIPGFSQLGEEDGEGETKDSNSSESSDNESKENPSGGRLVAGLTLPYDIPEANIQINAIGLYNGPFLEDGSDEDTENNCAIIVTNTSDQLLQYSELVFSLNGTDTMTFKIVNLPAKTATIVLESDRKTIKRSDVLEYKDHTNAYRQSLTLHEEELEISAVDNEITITNKTDKTMSVVYVYYKFYQAGDVYLGGITYRTKFENVEPGVTAVQGASHYLKDYSHIMMVDVAYAEE